MDATISKGLTSAGQGSVLMTKVSASLCTVAMSLQTKVIAHQHHAMP